MKQNLGDVVSNDGRALESKKRCHDLIHREIDKRDLFYPENPGPLGQFRDRWLCLGVLCLKSQIPIFND